MLETLVLYFSSLFVFNDNYNFKNPTKNLSTKFVIIFLQETVYHFSSVNYKTCKDKFAFSLFSFYITGFCLTSVLLNIALHALMTPLCFLP